LPKGSNIDFVSIDCEGGDLEVVTTLNFDHYRPNLILIEDSTLSEESAISKFMKKHNYSFQACCFHTKLFADKGFI
jgi:hypothetical protein